MQFFSRSPDLPITGSPDYPMAADLENNIALKKLRELDPEAVEDARLFRDEVTIYIRDSYLLRACEFLRDEPGLKFKFLADVTALDHYPQEPRFEVVYHLLSLETAQRLRLKVRVSGEHPHCLSVFPVWPSANAFEREVFDLFGIVFDGHPYLRRIMLPEEWEGYPLRKDYPTEGYR
jgi:NADH-quinone oxidoreductase subunit C